MFARTERLTLRPGWPEDAPELARAIGHEEVVNKLAQAPWPYALGDAQAWLADWQSGERCALQIYAHEEGNVRLVGGIGIERADGGHELGYWLTPSAWGRGYATEAGRAVVDMARHALGLKRLTSGHFVDNPASGRVLRKLGFHPTGRIVQRHCRARGGEVACATYELALVDCDGCGDADRIAA